MGTVAARLFRPLQNWNIENRAHKVISKDKPKPAPTFKSTKKQIDLVNQLNPTYKEEAKKKHVQLDENLKSVFVRSNSSEVQEIDSRFDPDRPLPKEKVLPEPFEYGFYEPTTIKAGRISLRQTIEFLNKHNKDPQKYTTEVIASEYKLDKKIVDDILDHYKVYEVVTLERNYNVDEVARPLRLSTKTGLTVPHRETKKVKEPWIIQEEPPEALEEKKHLKVGDK